MGQEQSGTTTAGGTASPTPSTGSTGGASSSFSFLTRKRTSTKIPQIVTVNNPNNPSTSESKIDEELKHIKEIPCFMPILRGVLASQRTPPDIYKKIESKYIFRFLQRLQRHLADCQRPVCVEQAAIGTQITETNQFIAQLVRQINERSRRYNKFASDMRKMSKQVSEQTEKIQLQLQAIIHGLDAINEFLPETERLQPIGITLKTLLQEPAAYDSLGHCRILPADECAVVDVHKENAIFK